MSKSKSRKKKAPKCVLALPDLEHAKTRSVAETVRRGRFGIMLQTLQVAETQQVGLRSAKHLVSHVQAHTLTSHRRSRSWHLC